MTALYCGHDGQERAFLDALSGGRTPHAWLLAGPQGLGKAHFAKRAATFLVADGDQRAAAGATTLDVAPDEQAARLIASGAHPEYIWLKREVAEHKRLKAGAEPREEDFARNITVAQARWLLTRLRVRPAISRWRAIIIDSVDDLERGAANALLKTLEEPPHNTMFFLISHRPGRLLPTIRSRCHVLRFAALDDAAMMRVLAQALPDVPAAEQQALVRVGQGAPGRALGFAQLQLAEMDKLLRHIVAHGDADNARRLELTKQVGAASERQRFVAMLSLAEAIAAEETRASPVAALGRCIAARDAIVDLASIAVQQSENPTSICFGVAGALATMRAPQR
ncbi:MAG: hypothetical protein ACKOUM_01525 [Sphingopyxis sp.]